MTRETAAARLRYGDEVRRRMGAGMTTATIATKDRRSPQVVAKTAWLANRYDQSLRADLGEELLGQLGPSQLEVAAGVERAERVRLLRRVVSESMSVRQLHHEVSTLGRHRSVGSGEPKPVSVIGGRDGLAAASKAVAAYATWGNAQLRYLINGPNGDVVLSLAEAGRALALRLDHVMNLGALPTP